MASGSVQKRKSVVSGRVTSWSPVVRFDDGTQKRLPAERTRKEAEAVLTKALHELRSGAYVVPSRQTLGEYLAEWVERTAATVRPSSLGQYERAIRRYVLPSLGDVPLAEVSPVRVQRCIEVLPPVTGQQVHMVLRGALEQAVRWRLLTVNPCRAVEAPKRIEREMRTWTHPARSRPAALKGPT